MKLLTFKQFEKITNIYDKMSFEIINEQSKILADIFDSKNKETCSNCNRNYQVKDKFKYEIKDGHKTRVYRPLRIKVKESGCCSSCASDNGYFRFFSKPCNCNNQETIINRLHRFKKVFNFNEKTGFFNLELKSCNLARELRSDVCLHFVCLELKLTDEEMHQVRKSTTILKGIKKNLNLPV